MTFHPFDPAISYNMEAHDRPPCRVCGRERVANPDHFKTEEANPMSDKDFTVTAEAIHRVLDGSEIARKQNVVRLYAVYGGAAVEHHYEDRVDVMTLDLAYCIAGQQFPEELQVDPLITVRRIVEDLEPRTSHLAGDNVFVTVWKNVGVDYSPSDLNRDYEPVE